MNAGKFISQLVRDGSFFLYILRASLYVVSLWSLLLTQGCTFHGGPMRGCVVFKLPCIAAGFLVDEQ